MPNLDALVSKTQPAQLRNAKQVRDFYNQISQHQDKLAQVYRRRGARWFPSEPAPLVVVPPGSEGGYFYVGAYLICTTGVEIKTTAGATDNAIFIDNGYPTLYMISEGNSNS